MEGRWRFLRVGIRDSYTLPMGKGVAGQSSTAVPAFAGGNSMRTSVWRLTCGHSIPGEPAIVEVLAGAPGASAAGVAPLMRRLLLIIGGRSYLPWTGNVRSKNGSGLPHGYRAAHRPAPLTNRAILMRLTQRALIVTGILVLCSTQWAGSPPSPCDEPGPGDGLVVAHGSPPRFDYGAYDEKSRLRDRGVDVESGGGLMPLLATYGPTGLNCATSRLAWTTSPECYC